MPVNTGFYNFQEIRRLYELILLESARLSGSRSTAEENGVSKPIHGVSKEIHHTQHAVPWLEAITKVFVQGVFVRAYEQNVFSCHR